MANKIFVCQSLIVFKRRGRRGNIALFYNLKHSDWGFQLVGGSAHCNSVYVDGMRWEHFIDSKQIPICQYLCVYKRRGDEATSPSFAIHHAAIEASSVSLEALIATLLPADGTVKEAIL